jgi:hypothetical protein
MERKGKGVEREERETTPSPVASENPEQEVLRGARNPDETENERKVLKLHHTRPDLSLTELAKLQKIPVEDVRRALQAVRQ